MAVETMTEPPMTDYAAIFRGYIVRSAQDISLRVQKIEGLLPVAEREQALHTLSYALKLAEAWLDTRALLLAMAPKMEQAGFRDEWLPYLEQGIRQSRLLDDIEAEAELHFQVGMLYELRGKYQEAQTHLEASIKGFETSAFNRARALNRLAYLTRQERRFDEATRLAQTALTLLSEQESERAYSYLVLGAVALDRGSWPESAKYFQRALDLWERENNRRMMGRTLLGLGAAWCALKNFQQAITSYQRAITLLGEVSDPVHQAIAQMNLGNVYLVLEQPREALTYYAPAKGIFQQAHDRLRQGQINYNIGFAYCQLKEWDKAEEAYLLSIKRYQQVGNIALLVDVIDSLGQVYLAKDQVREAVATFQEALNWLTNIEGQSGYEPLLTMVTTHLHEAEARLN